MSLFGGVIFHISSSFSIERKNEISYALSSNGGKEAETLQDATHVISNSNRFEGWQDVKEGVAVVTDKWVDRSMILGRLQLSQNYSADPSMIFSGVVACATELPAPDLEVLSAGITALGGQWRTGLTKDVTHLFALSNTSHKYATALHFQEHTHIKVLLPHWFDDAVRLGMGKLNTTAYEWPDPQLLRADPNQPEEGESPGTNGKKKPQKLDPHKKMLFRTALLNAEGGEADFLELVVKDVWGGRKVLLSLGLGLREQMREAVAIGIERAKGAAMSPPSREEELELISDCDVFVTRYRSGKAYVKAVREGKTIGTLAWVFHVQSTGVMTRPMDQLLHYPIPRRPIEGFSGHEITVTNYTGEAREYLKKLITTMGATFTPSMSGRNTALIAAYISGTKTTKAASWSIPIVNHTWLEDCFVKWRNLTVGLEKYIVFPPGVDFSVGLGERGVGRGVEEVWDEEELRELELEDDDEDMGVRVVEDEDEGHVVKKKENNQVMPAKHQGPHVNSEADVDMGNELEPVKPKSTSKPASRPPSKVKPSSKSEAQSEFPVKASSIQKSPSGLLVKARAKKDSHAQRHGEDDEDVERPQGGKASGRPSTTSRKKVLDADGIEDIEDPDGDDEDDRTQGSMREVEAAINLTSFDHEPEDIEGEGDSDVPMRGDLDADDTGGAAPSGLPPATGSDDFGSQFEDDGFEMPDVESVFSAPVRKAKGKATRAAKEDSEDEEEKALSRRKNLVRRTSTAMVEDDDEEEFPKRKAAAAKKAVPAKIKANGKTEFVDDAASGEDDEVGEEEDDDDDDVFGGKKSKGFSGKSKSKVSPAALKFKSKAKRFADSEDEDEDGDKSTTARAKKNVIISPVKYTYGKSAKDKLASSKKKAFGEDDESEDGDEEDEEKPKKTPIANAKAGPKGKPKVVEDDGDDEEEPIPTKKKSTATKPAKEQQRTPASASVVARPKPRTSLTKDQKQNQRKKETNGNSDAEEEEEEEKATAAPSTAKAPGKGKGKAAAPKARAEKVGGSMRKVVSVVMPGLNLITRHANLDSNDDAEDGDSEEEPTTNTGRKAKTVNVKGKKASKGKHPVPEDEETDEEESQRRKTEIKAKARVAVKGKDKGPAERENSAASASSTQSAVRGIQSLSVGKAAAGAKAKAKTTAVKNDDDDDDDDDDEDAMNVDEDGHQFITPAKYRFKSSRAGVAGPSRITPPPSTSRPFGIPADHSPIASTAGRSSVRRHAATKATQKLRHEIMPDVMNFQDEMRKSVRAGGKISAIGGAVAPNELVDNGAKSKKAAMTAKDDGEEERDEDGEEQEDDRDKKRRKLANGTGVATIKEKGKAKAVGEEEEDDDSQQQKTTALKRKHSGKPKSGADGAQKLDKPVHLMTTQVNLTDEEVKALTKLGVKLTTKPHECTHLVARQLVRTEKFLCALATAPHILTDRWVKDSITSKALQPEENYIMKDVANEKKFDVKLAESLDRAHKLRGKLFAGKTFYFTPKIPIDAKLLKNVVLACGGQVLNQTPTLRILNSQAGRVIISCPEDVSIWRPISPHHPIYSPELILASALKQETVWDNPAYRVNGSS